MSDRLDSTSLDTKEPELGITAETRENILKDLNINESPDIIKEIKNLEELIPNENLVSIYDFISEDIKEKINPGINVYTYNRDNQMAVQYLALVLKDIGGFKGLEFKELQERAKEMIEILTQNVQRSIEKEAKSRESSVMKTAKATAGMASLAGVVGGFFTGGLTTIIGSSLNAIVSGIDVVKSKKREKEVKLEYVKSFDDNKKAELADSLRNIILTKKLELERGRERDLNNPKDRKELIAIIENSCKNEKYKITPDDAKAFAQKQVEHFTVLQNVQNKTERYIKDNPNFFSKFKKFIGIQRNNEGNTTQRIIDKLRINSPTEGFLVIGASLLTRIASDSIPSKIVRGTLMAYGVLKGTDAITTFIDRKKTKESEEVLTKDLKNINEEMKKLLDGDLTNTEEKVKLEEEMAKYERIIKSEIFKNNPDPIVKQKRLIIANGYNLLQAKIQTAGTFEISKFQKKQKTIKKIKAFGVTLAGLVTVAGFASCNGSAEHANIINETIALVTDKLADAAKDSSITLEEINKAIFSNTQLSPEKLAELIRNIKLPPGADPSKINVIFGDNSKIPLSTFLEKLNSNTDNFLATLKDGNINMNEIKDLGIAAVKTVSEDILSYSIDNSSPYSYVNDLISQYAAGADINVDLSDKGLSTYRTFELLVSRIAQEEGLLSDNNPANWTDSEKANILRSAANLIHTYSDSHSSLTSSDFNAQAGENFADNKLSDTFNIPKDELQSLIKDVFTNSDSTELAEKVNQGEGHFQGIWDKFGEMFESTKGTETKNSSITPEYGNLEQGLRDIWRSIADTDNENTVRNLTQWGQHSEINRNLLDSNAFTDLLSKYPDTAYEALLKEAKDVFANLQKLGLDYGDFSIDNILPLLNETGEVTLTDGSKIGFQELMINFLEKNNDLTVQEARELLDAYLQIHPNEDKYAIASILKNNWGKLLGLLALAGLGILAYKKRDKLKDLFGDIKKKIKNKEKADPAEDETVEDDENSEEFKKDKAEGGDDESREGENNKLDEKKKPESTIDRFGYLGKLIKSLRYRTSEALRDIFNKSKKLEEKPKNENEEVETSINLAIGSGNDSQDLERILVSRGIISEVLTHSEEVKQWGEVRPSEGNKNRLDGERKSLYIDEKLFTYNKVSEFRDISDVGNDGKRVLTIEDKEENKYKILIDENGNHHKESKKRHFLDISEADTLGNRFIKVNKRKRSKNPFSREEIETGEEYVYIYIDKEGKRIFLENDNGKKISEFANIRLERNSYKWFELYKKDQTKLTSYNSIIAVDPDGKKVHRKDSLKSEFYNIEGSHSFDDSGKLILK